MWDLSSLTRHRTRIRCIARWILNHWTTREVPNRMFWFYPNSLWHAAEEGFYRQSTVVSVKADPSPSSKQTLSLFIFVLMTSVKKAQGLSWLKGYSTAKQWESLSRTTLSLTLNMAIASPRVLQWDSMARSCWILLRIPARLVQLVQLSNALGIWLERTRGSLLKAGEAKRLTFRLVWSCRASWAPTQFRARSSSWAHLRAREADNSFSPTMEANSAAVLSDAASPFLARTLAAS